MGIKFGLKNFDGCSHIILMKRFLGYFVHSLVEIDAIVKGYRCAMFSCNIV